MLESFASTGNKAGSELLPVQKRYSRCHETPVSARDRRYALGRGGRKGFIKGFEKFALPFVSKGMSTGVARGTVPLQLQWGCHLPPKRCHGMLCECV